MTCELCATDGGEILWRDTRLRVVAVDDAHYGGYCRVIWQAHAAEMSDLAQADRAYCMRAVFAVETALRELLQPLKINLASLGNFTPHVHWHVIPRFHGDAHFPQAIWAERQRDTPARAVDRQALRRRLSQMLEG